MEVVIIIIEVEVVWHDSHIHIWHDSHILISIVIYCDCPGQILSRALTNVPTADRAADDVKKGRHGFVGMAQFTDISFLLNSNQ